MVGRGRAYVEALCEAVYSSQIAGFTASTLPIADYAEQAVCSV
jgi:hypothetical protein